MTRDKNFKLTYVIIGINVSIFILLFFIDKSLSFSPKTLLQFGAKYNPMIASGQYYRLITSMFLHSDITHLLFNMYALNILGQNVEFVYGKLKFIIIYLIAGIFGSLGSFILSQSIAVGASGAIFGLLGAYLYLYISRPKAFSGKYIKSLLTIIGINLLLGIIIPNIDNWAHIWGLIGGFIISWAIGIKGEKTFTISKIFAQILTIVLICASLFTGIKINQNSWEYNVYKGESYLSQNKITEAELQFIDGLSKNDNIEIFHYYLGYINLEKGDTEKAKYHFQKLVELNPRFTKEKEILDTIG